MAERKSQYDDFAIITSYENLYNAHRSCKSGKLWKDSVASYDLRALESTLYLEYLLETGRYRISDYHEFTINERGKSRNIKSTKYKDRVVQKNLNDNILVPYILPRLIYENGASRKEKGTDFQIQLLKRHLREEIRKNGTESYILVGDFKGYFDSIRHDVLQKIYEKYFSDERLLKLIEDIHASIPGGVGVPLGNQLSQADALIIASHIDHMIKEQMHIRGYGRYNDDFYLIHKDKEYLKECLEKIEKECNKIGIRLNIKKTKIVPMSAGMDFLGFHYYVTKTGKVVMRIKATRKSHERQKLKKQAKKVIAGEMAYEDAKTSYKSWRSHAERGDTFYMLQEMDLYFYTQFRKFISENEKQEMEKLKRKSENRKEMRRKKHGKTTK